MKAAGLSGNYIDWWCTDKPCWGRNGTEFTMGRNGQVVGRDHDYTDWQATQECIRIVNEHDTDIPLFFYVAFQVSRTYLCPRVSLPAAISLTRVSVGRLT